jgi:ankyrin repeat protein
MAAAPPGGGGGNGGNGSDDDNSSGENNRDFALDRRVYAAVAAGEPAERVGRMLAEASSPAKRKAAANGETPLQAAHRLRRGDLVAAILLAGADARALFPGGRCNALALLIHYGQAGALRELLRAGAPPAPDAPVPYCRGGLLEGGRFDPDYIPPPPGLFPSAGEDDEEGGSNRATGCAFSTPVHLCIVPPRRDRGDPVPPPQLECLRVLVGEFQGDVNARDARHNTPLHWLDRQPEGEGRDRALEALLQLGADVNALNDMRNAPIHNLVRDVGVVRRLLAAGASVDHVGLYGWTPLLMICSYGATNPPPPEAVATVLRASSDETRRSVEQMFGRTALEWIAGRVDRPAELAPWELETALELLRSRCAVRPELAARLLPQLARHAGRLEGQAKGHAASAGKAWRWHEAMVGLAFDFQEAREADEAVAAAERRVRELEQEERLLLLRGGGSGEAEAEEKAEGGGGAEGEGAKQEEKKEEEMSGGGGR